MSIQTVTLSETPTDNFLGQCKPCMLPLRINLPGRAGNTATLDCTGCGQPFTLQRIAGTVTADYCDGACMSAVGPNCSCSCDGSNHGASWHGGPRRERGEKLLYDPPADTPQRRAALAKHRAKTERTRQRNAERKAAREAERLAQAKDEFDAWLESLTVEQARVVEHLRNRANTVEAADFLYAMGNTVRAGHPLTPRQLDSSVRWVTGDWERQASDAQEAINAEPLPLGRHTVTVDIISTKTQDGYRGGSDFKMLAKGQGWKIWMTVPNALFREVDYVLRDLRGRRVQMTVTIKPSDDPHFGYGQRATDITLLP